MQSGNVIVFAVESMDKVMGMVMKDETFMRVGVLANFYGEWLVSYSTTN